MAVRAAETTSRNQHAGGKFRTVAGLQQAIFEGGSNDDTAADRGSVRVRSVCSQALVEKRVLTKPTAIAKTSKTLRARPFGNLLFETSFIESLDQRFSIL